MMTRGIVVGSCALLLLTGFSPTGDSRFPQAETTIKSVHLINLPIGLTEADLLATLGALNEAIHSTGHLDAGYVLWKVTDAQVDEYASVGHEYIMEGVWPSQAVYDEIHETAAWQEARAASIPVVSALGEVQLYSRYRQMRVGGPGEK